MFKYDDRMEMCINFCYFIYSFMAKSRERATKLFKFEESSVLVQTLTRRVCVISRRKIRFFLCVSSSSFVSRSDSHKNMRHRENY